MNTEIDMTGQTFGHLTVTERAPSVKHSKGARWVCRCDCGNEVIVLGNDLRRGYRTSCGCTRNKARTASSEHKKTDHPVEDAADARSMTERRSEENGNTRMIDAVRLVKNLQEIANQKREEGKTLHAEIIAEFIACIEAEPTVNQAEAETEKWIPVKERRPPDTAQTIMFVRGIGKGRVVDVGRCCGNARDDWYSSTAKGTVPCWMVTHWRHIPELPEDEST